MNDTEQLTACVERDPDSDVVAFMLVDELMSARDMLETEAWSHVSRIREAARQARHLSEAAALMRPGSAARSHLRRAIMRELPIPHYVRPTILIQPGHAPPVATQNPAYAGSAYWGGATVVVGAGWITQAWQYRNKALAGLRALRAEERKRRK